MKKTLLFVIVLLVVSMPLVLTGGVVPPEEPEEPICEVPCEPPIYDASTLPEIRMWEMDGSQELLGITKDGCYILRYKGKIYIWVPKHLKQ